jgi:hypothetical protein
MQCECGVHLTDDMDIVVTNAFGDDDEYIHIFHSEECAKDFVFKAAGGRHVSLSEAQKLLEEYQ